MEIQNKDMSWPEELLQLEIPKENVEAENNFLSSIILYPGARGIMNMGNTCYISAALQTLSNIKPLTETFIGDKRLVLFLIFFTI